MAAASQRGDSLIMISRRKALGAMGATTAAASALASSSTQAAQVPPTPAVAPPESVPLAPSHSHGGVQGRMTGAMAAVQALRCQQVPCVFGVPGAQNNEFWDCHEVPRPALPARHQRILGQHHG